MLLTLYVTTFISLASHVHAHGYVSNVTVDGTVYPGNAPGHYTVASPIRTVSSNSPVTNVSSPDLACGLGAVNAALDAPAYPGSAVNFTWVSGGGGNWPHEVGPVLTYMASCLNVTTCAGFNASAAEWFKITEDAKRADGASWVQQLIMEGDSYNVTIPEGLTQGAYLMRNELIGLQNAMSPGGAEFFPSCTQLRILGNGTEVPAPNSTVRFPGAYNETDPGVLVDAYTDPDTPYEIPGPSLATFVDARSLDETNGTFAMPAASSAPLASYTPPTSPISPASSTSPAPSTPPTSFEPEPSDNVDDVPSAPLPPIYPLPQESTQSSMSTPSSVPITAPLPTGLGEAPLAPVPVSPTPVPGLASSEDGQAQLWIPMVDATPMQPEMLERRARHGHSRVMGRIAH
ncbi:glycosyl hydrolase family 61-domain-containing protein [Fomitopsis serialis]|uniref:glycosyl hydrolase family 61-domain-containing protein n=1 Tax=Fomitopsis serialis TaxID=139415 RepID=UPI0020084268|nr:glycosyl hydrolase family 61-domain-containing protein [Neoantrodia serialis]KAH9929183.1 glycosyl hydrolase family 61-domain-containing protein [Neoantrodia serialis]